MSRRNLKGVKYEEETSLVSDLSNLVSFTEIVQIEDALDYEAKKNELIISHTKFEEITSIS